MSSIIINKTDTISVCGDTVFLEIDNILPTWSHYCFKLTVDTPGTKTIVFRVRQPQEPDPKPSSASEITTETKLKQEVDAIKFEEDVTMVADVEEMSDVKVKNEDTESVDGILTSLRSYYHRCPVSPCVHLGQRTGNPDPATRDILRAQKRPWRHIVRPFEASEIPHRVAELEAARAKRRKFEEEEM